MFKKLFALFAATLVIINGCSGDNVSSVEPGTLKGKVTVDGEGVSGVEIIINTYSISGKPGSPKVASLAGMFDVGDYSFELYAGVYRADYSYYGSNNVILTTARYPITVSSDAETVVDVELKDPIPHSFLAADGDAAVELSWESGYGAAHYRLYRSQSPDGFFYIISQVDTANGTVYYTDHPPNIGTYYYRITSVDSSSLESDYEETRQVDFTAAIRPPTGLQAIDMVDFVQLRWDEKPQAVRYHIFRSKGNEGNWTAIDTVYGNVNSYNDVPTDTSVYYYRLTAISSYGTESSPGASALVHYDRRFDPPQGLTIVDRGSSLYLTWQGYSNISYYSVYRSAVSNSDYQHINNTPNTYYSDTPVDTGIYYYYVTVTSPNGQESDPSDTISGHFDRILDFPSNFQVENMGLYVALSWEEVEWAGAYILLRMDEGDNAYYQIGRVDGSVMSFIDTPSDSGLFHYQIATETVTGVIGNRSYPVTVLFTNNLLTPQGVYAENMGTFISISWDSVAGADGYKVYRSQSEGGSFEYIDSTYDNYYNDVPIEQGSYYYKIQAFDLEGHLSPFSNTAYAFFDGCPLPPYNVTAVDSLYKVYLNWEAIDTGGEFMIYRSVISDSNYTLVDSSFELTAFDWPPISGRYYYKVQIIVDNDTSGLSEFGSVHFSGTLDPPTNLSAYDAGSHVHLEWTAPAGASYYEIYRRLESDTEYQWIGTVPGTYADDAPVLEGTYFYKVKAFTRGDLGSPDSAPVQVYFDP